MFELLIWAGTGLTLAGIGGLVWCILRANRIRRDGLKDEELRAALMAILPYNLGALLLSALGLILVVMGIMLG